MMLLQRRHQNAHGLPRSCPTCVGRLPLACQAAAVTADRAVDKDPRSKLQKVVVLGGTGRVGGSTAEALLDRHDSNILMANLLRQNDDMQHAEQRYMQAAWRATAGDSGKPQSELLCRGIQETAKLEGGSLCCVQH